MINLPLLQELRAAVASHDPEMFDYNNLPMVHWAGKCGCALYVARYIGHMADAAGDDIMEQASNVYGITYQQAEFIFNNDGNLQSAKGDDGKAQFYRRLDDVIAQQKPRTLRKIITTFVYPPIPVRNMDWQAHFDGDEPNDDGQMTCGHGATKEEAIANLLIDIDTELVKCARCGQEMYSADDAEGCEDLQCPMVPA